MKNILKYFICFLVFIFSTNFLLSQKVKSINLVYDQPFENMKYSFDKQNLPQWEGCFEFLLLF